MVAIHTNDAAVAKMLSSFEALFVILILLGPTLAFGGVHPVSGNQSVEKRGQSVVKGNVNGLFIRLIICEMRDDARLLFREDGGRSDQTEGRRDQCVPKSHAYIKALRFSGLEF